VVATVVWQSGFEVGTAAGAATGNSGVRFVDAAATAAISSSNPRSGTYSLSLTGTTAIRNVQLTTLVSGNTAVVASGFFMFPSSLPGADVDVIIVTTLAMDLFLFFDSADNRIKASWETSGVDTSGPVLAADTWYHIDLSVDVSTGTSTLLWAINGVAQTNATYSQSASTVSNLTLGRLDASTGTYRFDDWVASVTAGDYPLGPHKIVLLKPDTGGTAAEIGTANATARFTANGTLDSTFNSANILTATSEVPPTIGASADGVHQRTSGTTNAVELPLTTYTLAGGETITAVRAVVVGWSASATANNIELRGYDGSSETTLFARADPNFDNSTTTPAWLCAMWSNTWSQAKLDAAVLRYGYSNDVSPVPGAHFLGLEVAIKQSPPAPSAVAAIASVPAVTVTTGGGGDASVSPSAVAATGSIPAPTLSTGSTVSPSAVAAVASVPAPAVALSVQITPAAVATTASMGAPTVTTGSTVAPSATAATANIPTPTPSTGSTITPTAVAGTAAIGSPAISAGSTASPGSAAATAAVPAATVTTGNAATPSAVAGVAGVDVPTISASSTVTPTAVAATAAIAAPAVSAGATITLTTVAGVAAIGAVTVTSDVTVGPATVAAVTAIGGPVVSAGSTVTPGAVAAVASIPAPTVTARDRIVHRPDTGTVARPSTGTVVRPFTGTVIRP